MNLHLHIERLVVDIGQDVPTAALESQLLAAIGEHLARQAPQLQALAAAGQQHWPLIRGNLAGGTGDLAQRIGQSLAEGLSGPSQPSHGGAGS